MAEEIVIYDPGLEGGPDHLEQVAVIQLTIRVRKIKEPAATAPGIDSVNPEDELLTGGSAATRQGTQRLDRGEKALALGASVAETNGWSFDWRMVVEPEIGHFSSQMLRSRRILELLGLHELAPVYRIPAPAGDVAVRLRMRGFGGRSGEASELKTARAA